MKLLLIGQSVEDHIFYKGGQEVKPGGIYYSVSAMQNIKDVNDEIYLCTAYREGDPLFSNLYNMVNTSFLNYTDIIPTVRLNIYDDREREEIYENITGRLDVKAADLNMFDGILINMITGFDISLEQLESIRNTYDGPVYFDVHTFSRGLNDKMERKFRLIPGFDNWLRNIDILQVNTRELFTVADSDNKEEIIRYVLGTNVKYLLETQGEKGAVCYSITDGNIIVKEMRALKTNVKNQVGLGDVFGAVFFYTYIKNRSVDSALKYAVTASGYAASYGNMKDFNKLKNDVFSRNN